MKQWLITIPAQSLILAAADESEARALALSPECGFEIQVELFEEDNPKDKRGQ